MWISRVGPSHGDEPSQEELIAENTHLRERVAELEAALAAVEIELDKVRHELGRHSGNSGKPPSSDTLTQRAAQNEQRLSRQERRRLAREKAKKLYADEPKRRPGKQPGTAGTTLGPVDDPDCVMVHVPDTCGGCGGSLEGSETTGCETRQVFDLPTRHLEVTEHQAVSRRCSCGHTTKAPFPPEARAPVTYGPLLRAVAVYLMVCQHVPVARTAELLSQVCGAPVSTGWLGGLLAEAAGGLHRFIEAVKAELIAADVLHADETGARISGARKWFHVACTDLLTLLDCHDKRGVEAFSDMGVLPLFGGVLVTDGWKPYWSVGAFDHALCLAHILRDLAAVAEHPDYTSWADDMADLLVEAKKLTEAALDEGRVGLEKNRLKSLRARYTMIIKRGLATIPEYHWSGSLARDASNLLKRLDTQRSEITRYWSDLAVEPTNNAAERDLRMVKLQQKISGTFRTMTGAKAFCAVRSYAHSADKHGLGQLDVLVRLFKGDPWMPSPAGSSP